MPTEPKYTPEQDALLKEQKQKFLEALRNSFKDPDCDCPRCQGVRAAIKIVKNTPTGNDPIFNLPKQATAQVRQAATKAITEQLNPHQKSN